MSDGKLVIETDLETKKFDAQLKELEYKLKTMTKTLETESQIDASLRMSESERLKLEKDIETTKNKILSLKESMDKASGSSDKMNNNMSKSFNKGVKTLKRFALSLFGIGSMFTIVSKASSSYLSQNEALANKLQSVWVGLGSFMEPVLTMISDALLKALGYLNVFIKALTGVDYIARANAKALDNQAKSQKGLNKATQDYDFDVIRKQQEVSSESSSSTSGVSGLIEIPELNESLVNKIQKLGEFLKDNYKWLLAIAGVVGAYFTAKKIGNIVKSLGLLIGGSSSGLLGVSSLLKGLATMGIIAIGVDLIYKSVTGRSLFDDLKEIVNGISEVKNTYKANADAAEKGTKKLDSMTDAFVENAEAGKYTEDQMSKLVGVNKTMVENLATQTTELKNNTNWWNIGSRDARRQMKENVKQIEILTGKYGDLYDQGLLNEDQAKQYYDMLYMQIGLMNDLGEDTTELREKYKELTGERYEITLEAKAKENVSQLLDKMAKVFPMIDKYKDIFERMNIVRSSGGSGSFGGGSGGGTRGEAYAYGGIVTQPTRALIGEAGYNEYVLPEREDYLSRLASLIGQYGGNNGGPTYVYLDGRLIQRQVSNKKNQVDFTRNR